MKKAITYIFGFIAVALLIIAFSLSRGTTSNESDKPSSGEERMIFEESNGYTIKIDYPKTESEAANRKVESIVSSSIDEFKDFVEENPPSEDFPTYELNIEGILYVEEGVSSLVLHEFTYSGGAHGSEQIHSINWDYETKELVDLEDFLEGKTSIEQVSELARRQLLASDIEFTDESWLSRGTEPTVENYDTWWIEMDELTIQFQEYQVAPYFVGMPTVIIPLKDL